MNPTALAPAPTSADFGLVAAMSMEVGPLLDRLERVRKFRARKTTVIEGEHRGKVVAVVLTGMGRARAQRGAETLVDGHRPRLLISAGYAGALDPELKRGEIVVPRELVNIEGRRFAVDTFADLGPHVRSGRLLTGDAVVRTAAEKAELRAKFEADLVDMETSAVAAYAAERGTRFLPVRIVSDDAHVDLPREILTIVGETGGVRLGATAAALWKRPSVVGDLLKMRVHAMEAAETLSNFLADLIARGV